MTGLPAKPAGAEDPPVAERPGHPTAAGASGGARLLFPRLPLVVTIIVLATGAALVPAAASLAVAGANWWQVTAATFVAAVSAALVAMLLVRGLARPMRAQLAAMNLMAEGEMEIRLDTRHQIRELGTFASSFNRMAEAVQESTDTLVHRAFHDPLTGLPNRALFLSGFTRALATGQRARRVAVMFMDVDRFKFLNDTLGHGVGDQLLSVLSQRLVGAAEGQMVARLGGDEFTVLVQSTNAELTALRIADRITQAFARPFSLAGQELFVTTSIGIAVSGPQDRTSTELLRKADIALYRAKAEGRARYVLFQPGQDTVSAEQFDLDNALRRSVERNELLLHYQPLVDLRTGNIAAVEALLRWDHPHRGILSPATFISIAEETGEIIRIGQWVLEEACRQTVEFQRQRPHLPLTVCVNISAAEFRQRGLVGRVKAVLDQSGLPPAQLKLELTESVLIEDIPATLETLGDLKALGVGLAIDDFGTGYSSLSYLQRLPVDTLKVDQSFIARLGVDPASGPVLRAIVEMGNALKMTVVAEGIENAWQWDFLSDIGCKLGQGHLFREAVDAEEFSTLVAAHGPLAQRRPKRLPRAV